MNGYTLLDPYEFKIIKTLELKFGKNNVKIINDHMNPNYTSFILLMSYTRPYKFTIVSSFDKYIKVNLWETPYWNKVIELAYYGKSRFTNPFMLRNENELLIFIKNIKEGEYKKYEDINRKCIEFKRINQQDFQEIYYYIISAFKSLLDDQFFYDKCKKIGIEKIGKGYKSIELRPVILYRNLTVDNLYDIVDKYIINKVMKCCEQCKEYCNKNNSTLLYLTNYLSPSQIFSNDIRRYINSTYKFDKRITNKYETFYK